LQLVFGPKNVKSWRALNTEDPYRGEVLLWYVARWTTLFFGLLGAVGTYFLIRATQPGYPWLALSGAALLAFLPTYLFISSVISYETLTGALLALYFLFLFYLLNNPAQSWLYFMTGLLLGLAASTRYTPVPALPILPLLIIWLAYRHGWSWRTTIYRVGLAGLGIALTFGSWVLYSVLFFNKVTSQGLAYGLLNPFLVSDGSDTVSLQIINYLSRGELGAVSWEGGRDSILQWAWNLFGGMWGRGWLAWIFLGLSGVAVAGLVRDWLGKERQTRMWIVLLGLHVGVFIVFPLLRFLVSGDLSTGRTEYILFPAGAAIILLLIYGLRSWLSPTRLTWLLLVFVALYLPRATLAIIRDFASPWPIQTVPLSDGEQALVGFDQLSLLGYGYQADDQTLQVTLQWRVDALMAEDYRIELTLLDSSGEPQTRWLGQPLNGRYPTRAWAEGDRVRDVVEIPVASLRSGDYGVQLRLLGETEPVPPVMTGAQTSSMAVVEGDHLKLAPVTLEPAAVSESETIILNGREIDYTYWPGRSVGKAESVYRENSTVIVSTAERLGDEIKLSLVGPDGQPHPPVERVGVVYIFNVAPYFVSGEYRLRFEELAGSEVVAQADSETLLELETQERQFELTGPISQPVSANFAGYVALLGYDLPQRRVEPGQSVPITLYWQALRTIGADLIFFNHLIGEDQEIRGGRDRLAREVYSTMLWVPGEVVTDPFEIQVDPAAPEGIYNVLVGIYLPVGEASVSLPLMEAGEFSDVTSVRAGPILVGETPPGLIVDGAEPQVPLNQPFGETPSLTLLGYDLAERSNGPAPGLGLTLYWRSESPLETDYTTFVHLRNRAGETIAQQDQLPLNGAYPISLWAPGEIIADQINLPVVPEALPADGYSLVVGLYDFETGQRLPVPDNAANEVTLIRVE